jgi:hypothetical protein
MLALGAQQNLQKQALYVLLTPDLILGVFIATIVFCIGASAASAVKIVRVDPGVVFHT